MPMLPERWAWEMVAIATDAENFRDATYVSGIGFVFIGQGSGAGIIYTSPTGAVWTARTSPAPGTQSWRAVAYSPTLGRFVVVGNNGAVATSDDNGVTWTARTAASVSTWWSVTWGSGRFVAVALASGGGVDRTMSSPDGITWTSHPATAVLQWASVTWSATAGLFIALASNTGITNGIMTSPDGATWTARTSLAANNLLAYAHALAPDTVLGKTVYLYESPLNARRLAGSTDGLTWTSTSAATPSVDRAVQPLNMPALAVLFATVRYDYIATPDGTAWTQTALPVPPISDGGGEGVAAWADDLGVFVSASLGNAFVRGVYTFVPPVVITIAPPTLPTGFVGIPYGAMFTATGGTAPYAWSVVSGTLPPGLALASDGALSGTPTTLGTFAFQVRAVDVNGAASSATSYSIVITGAQHMPGYPVLGGKFIAFTNGAPLFLPLANGKVYTYQNRTATPYPTYTDGTLLVQNSNPVDLDSAGRASIFIPDRSVMTYTFVVKDVNGVIVYTENDISVPAVPPAASTAGLGVVPTGSILPYGGENTPGNVAALALLGYLFCDGTVYSNAAAPAGYQTLFNVIGYKYGGSSGSFAVPDYRGRMPLGVAAAGPAPIVCGASGGEFNHVHTGPSHTHTAPAHVHDLAAHAHPVPFNAWTTNINTPPVAGVLQAGGSGVGAEASVSQATTNNVTGASTEILTGNPTTSLVTTFGGTGNTGVGNPPYLTATFIIKT